MKLPFIVNASLSCLRYKPLLMALNSTLVLNNSSSCSNCLTVNICVYLMVITHEFLWLYLKVSWYSLSENQPQRNLRTLTGTGQTSPVTLNGIPSYSLTMMRVWPPLIPSLLLYKTTLPMLLTTPTLMIHLLKTHSMIVNLFMIQHVSIQGGYTARQSWKTWRS